MAIADAVDLPIIIYNIPPRSVIDMSLGTMKRLSEHSNIVGVKDATQDLVRPLATRLEIGPDFCQLSGEDATIVPYLSQGGHGVYLSLAMLHLGRFQKCIKLGKR